MREIPGEEGLDRMNKIDKIRDSNPDGG